MISRYPHNVNGGSYHWTVHIQVNCTHDGLATSIWIWGFCEESEAVDTDFQLISPVLAPRPKFLSAPYLCDPNFIEK